MVLCAASVSMNNQLEACSLNVFNKSCLVFPSLSNEQAASQVPHIEDSVFPFRHSLPVGSETHKHRINLSMYRLFFEVQLPLALLCEWIHR